MSTTRTIQRSPDLGIGIRLQRLPQAMQHAFASPPQPPWWWGWTDANGKRATTLDVPWGIRNTYELPDAFPPGVWVAVVEGASAVVWEIEFTPTIWFVNAATGVSEIVWQSDPIVMQLPPALPADPDALFTPKKISIPDTLHLGGEDIASHQYWPGAYYTPGFPELPIPRLVAAGNTLSVSANSRTLGGHPGGPRISG